MPTTTKNSALYRTLAILGILIAVVFILHTARTFLIPIALAAIISMLLNPLMNTMMEKWNLPRWLAIVGSMLLVLICLGIFWGLVGAQISRLVSDWPQLERRMGKEWGDLQNWIGDNFGFSIEQAFTSQEGNLLRSLREMAVQSAGTATGILSDGLLVLVYIVLMLLLRNHFRKGVVMLVADQHKGKAHKIINKTVSVASDYLRGRLILIAIVAVIYSVGFVLIGIEYGLFLGIFGAILTLIPYIGNIIAGVFITAIAFVTGSSMIDVLWVVGIMSLTQVVESYILEPWIVGQSVEINEFATIAGVIGFGLLWGIAGMVLALPILGMIRLIFCKIPGLEPLGFLLSEKEA